MTVAFSLAPSRPSRPLIALVAAAVALLPGEARANNEFYASAVLALFVLAPTLVVFLVARRLLTLVWRFPPVLATALIAWLFWLDVPAFLDSITSVFAGGFGLPLVLGLLLVWLLVRWRRRRSPD